MGKTSLLQRLQGFNFKDEYVPSEEIQVANIQWNFKTSDEVVKVEIWDVVDKSSKKKTISSLKVSNSAASDSSGVGETEQFGLDAETLDVYKGAHGIPYRKFSHLIEIICQNTAGEIFRGFVQVTHDVTLIHVR